MPILLADAVAIVDHTAELAKTGLLGTLLAIALGAVAYLWVDGRRTSKECELQTRLLNERFDAALKALHEQRGADQQAMTTTLLRTTTECVQCLTTVANGMEAQRDVLERIQNAVDRRQSSR